MKKKILIASPSYDGSVRVEYVQSVMAVMDYFRTADIEFEFLVKTGTILHVLRSVMASKVLVENDYTHLLFIDTDMGFNAGAVKRMVDENVDVIGCAYPYRSIPLHESVSKAGESFRKAISEIVPYAITHTDATDIKVANGVCRVQSIGTGLLLISKSALRVMSESGEVGVYRASFPYDQWYGSPNYFGFFEHINIDGSFLGEDYSFCYRWINNCAGKIYAIVNEEIMHIGALPVLGRYLDKLKAGRR